MSSRRAPMLVAVVVWVALVVGAHRAGLDISKMPRVAVGAAPLVGRWSWDPNIAFVWPLLIAATTVAVGPSLARSLSWRRLLLVAIAWGACWTVALATTEGTDRLTAPLETRYEYLAAIDAVDTIGVSTFVSTYTERLGDYPTHVRGHPPGATLVFVALDRVGLGGSGWAAAFVIGIGVSAAAAVLLTLRQVVDETSARTAAPFLALLPAAIWLGTSTDAMFTGVIAWGVALAAMAVGAVGSRRAALGFAAGVVVAGGLFVTYGAVPLVLLPVGVVVAFRAWRVVPAAVAGGACVVLVFAVAGFWWFDGFEATRAFYESGVSQRRPFGYFALLGNPAAFALAIGPAAVAAVVGLRDRRIWLLVGCAIVAVVVANVSGFSKGEVERIWLPFAPWVVAATAGLRNRVEARTGLALQAATALVVEAWLVSPW